MAEVVVAEEAEAVVVAAGVVVAPAGVPVPVAPARLATLVVGPCAPALEVARPAAVVAWAAHRSWVALEEGLCPSPVPRARPELAAVVVAVVVLSMSSVDGSLPAGPQPVRSSIGRTP